jgi:hypothetical protein
MYIIMVMMLLTDDQIASRVIDQKEAMRIAEKTRTYLVENVKDYTGMLIKREYIDGKDTGYQYMQFKLREEPISIYLKYLKPKSIQNREVLYTGGNELLVKRGGRHNSNMTLVITTDSVLITDNNRYSIQEMGLRKIAERLISQMNTEISIPNTEIVVYDNAKLDGRLITHYRLIHHTKDKNAIGKMVELAIDNELHIPIYYRALGWGEPTIVLEEYAFRNVILNAGLTDKDFSANNPDYGFQKK